MKGIDDLDFRIFFTAASAQLPVSGREMNIINHSFRGGSRGGGDEGDASPPPAHGGFFSRYKIPPIARLFNATCNE